MSRFLRMSSVVVALLFGLLTVGVGPTGTAVAAARPVVTKVGSGSGPLAQTTIVVTGKNLRGARSVTFGSKKGTIVRRISASAVEVRTPRGVKAGTVSVRIKTGGGWSRASKNARYTFVAVPTITKLSAVKGSFAGGQRLTITGRNLRTTTQVLVGTAPATIVSRATTKVVVTTPVGVLGKTSVKVVTVGGTSRGARYTYVAPAALRSTTVTPRAGTTTATDVEWVTGGYDVDTGETNPWLVGLPARANVPALGAPFLVRPGNEVFPSGLAGTVVDVAVQADDTVRVSVAPSDLAQSLDRLQIRYSGPVDTQQALRRQGMASTTPGRMDAVEVSRGTEFAIDGPSALSCHDAEGQFVPFGVDLTMSITDIDVSERLDLGGFIARPTFDGAFTAEVKTEGKITVAAQATCKLKPAWQNAQRRIIPLGTTGATLSFGPTLELKVSAEGTWKVVDRTRTTFAVHAKLGSTPTFSRTARNVESKQTGALSFKLEVTAGASVQFGVLDRAGIEGKVELGVSAELEISGSNVCLEGKLFFQIGIGFFLDAWVARWEANVGTLTINLLELRGCALPEGSAPPGEPEITSARLPDAQLGAAYGATLTTADNRNGAWSIVEGLLPAGLSLDGGSGQISGTPTGVVGDFPVIVDFTDVDGQVATTTIRVRVQPSRGIGGGDIQVTLRWAGPADLDLHVLDPNDEEIYFRNKIAASGGRLDKDANAACNGPEDDDNAVENVFWPPRSAPVGSYTAWVVVYAVCDGPLDWHLTVRRNGVVVIDETGSGSSEGYGFGVGQGARVQVLPRPATGTDDEAK